MGFLSRLLIPRGIRRAAHPVRTARRAVTPKPVKQLHRAMHPVSNANYAVQRSLTTKKKRRGGRYYTHDGCTVRHRTEDTAQRCRNR